ncbi:MAG: hypothetical protein QHH18_07420 [Candidatus Bathyarchaeota archaeon]|jgi:hypothetical protein|nr:hypothetical protein [Candidatus Bathyarchaeota archaeon A05DMB-5]MDH7558411.1 hypothetical protein [Candidatus Bathyarchaeota archaeon]
MKRTTNPSKHALLILALPLLTITIITIAYGTFHDQITTQLTLATTPKPTITTDIQLINAPNNDITIIVNSENKTILDTDPTTLQILTTITNTAQTPINALTINTTIPNNWQWTQQLTATLITTETTIPIDETQYTINHDPTTQTLLITIPNIKTATGQKLNQNNQLTITYHIEYTLKGEQIPEEYRFNPPTYETTTTTTAMTETEGWKSDPTQATLYFTTHIYLL